MNHSFFSSLAILICFSCIIVADSSHAQNTNPQTLFAQFLTLNNATTIRGTSDYSHKKISLSDKEVNNQSAVFKNIGAYTAANIDYPELAKENGIEGTVTVMVLISPKGDITATRVIKSLGFGCDEAVLDLLYNMPRWKPAFKKGIPVKEEKKLDFSFRLR